MERNVGCTLWLSCGNRAMSDDSDGLNVHRISGRDEATVRRARHSPQRPRLARRAGAWVVQHRRHECVPVVRRPHPYPLVLGASR